MDRKTYRQREEERDRRAEVRRDGQALQTHRQTDIESERERDRM